MSRAVAIMLSITGPSSTGRRTHSANCIPAASTSDDTLIPWRSAKYRQPSYASPDTRALMYATAAGPSSARMMSADPR